MASPSSVNAENIINISGPSFAPYFPIGEPIQLEFREKKFNSVFRGLKVSKYILADIPLVGGKHIFVDYNTVFTFRFFSSGSVYGFTSYLTRIHSKQGLLVLEFPESIKKYNMRTSSRVNLIVPVKVIVKDLQGIREGAILDLSSHGALLALNAPENIESGRRLKISLVLPDGKEVKSILAITCNAKASGNKTLLGIGFDDKDQASIDTIRSFYNDCLGYVGDSTEPVKNEGSEIFGVGQEITLEMGKKKIVATLTGWKLGEKGYILVDSQAGDKFASLVKSGEDAVVRSVKYGTLFGLEARFQTVLEKTNLWMFGIGEDILKFPLRADDRSYCLIPAKILEDKEGKAEDVGKGMIFNLSLGGLKLLTKYPVRDFLYLRLSFPLGSFGVVSTAKVKMVRCVPQGQFHEFAGSFVNLGKEDEQTLRKFFEFCKSW